MKLLSTSVLAMLLMLAGSARAQVCPHQGLAGFGFINAGTFGYPAYYIDQNGLALGECDDPLNLLCGALPPLPNPAAPLDIATNFFSEFPYTFVTATVPMPGGGIGLAVFSVLGTFAPLGVPAVGAQVVFSRERFRIDTPAAGTYTITHPFGVQTFTAAAAGRRSINFTDDCLVSVPPTCGVGLNPFTTPLAPFSFISNWLQWDATPPAPPAGFIGDPAFLHKVTGSPCGTNFFRVEGPGLPAGGVQTDLWSVVGKKADICGNGILDATEQCDDGNTADGDCCSSSCRFEPAGSACNVGCSTASTCNATGVCQIVGPVPGPCSDGAVCTTADVCAAGACVGGPPPACPATPIEADVSPKANSPTTKFGTAKTLAVDAPAATKQAFLRFRVTGVGTRPIGTATVRLQVAAAAGSQSDSGGRIHAIANCTWSETAMTWNTGRPAIDPVILSSVGPVARNQVVDFNVTPAINAGDGVYCFAIDTLSTDEVDYNSREAATGKPQLLLTFADGCGCAVPVCGDNAVNQPTEQCDGRTDFACPGRCLANCTCAPIPTTTTTSTSSTTSTTSGVPTTTSTSLTPVPTTTTSTLPPATAGTSVYQAGVSGPAGSANVDTYLRLSTPTTNNGTTLDVIVGLTNAANKVNRALMAFNLAGIPPTATVTSCGLQVNVLQSTSATPGHIRRICGEHWLDGDGQGETQATWNEWKTGSAWGAAGASSTADCALGGDISTVGEVAYTPPAGTGAFTFPDLSGLCQDAVALRGGWLRLRISQDAEATQSNLIRFDSSEGATAANHPKLTVTWTAP